MNKGFIGAIESFEVDDNWTLWQERLNQFFTINDVVNTKKAGVLITLLGKKGYELSRNLCMPANLKDKTYEELTELMKTHLEPALSEITERYNFKKCVQKESENVKSFCAKLKSLATHCNFGAELSYNLQDQFVCGIRCESTKRRLLGENDLDLEKAVRIATAMEMASKDVAGMNMSSSSSVASVNYMKKDKQEHEKGPLGICM
ncbi:hypothetical protein TKK_0013797 [Trichogramma kaykai]